MVDTSSNKNPSKTSEELVKKKLDEAMAAYASYLFTKSNVLEIVSEKTLKALPPLEKIIRNLDEFGECKNFLTNDQEALQKCIDEYNFKDGLLRGISAYYIWKRTPEQIKEFTNGLKALAKRGKQVIEDLYNRYQQYKTTSVPQEDLDPRLFVIIPEIDAIESLILRYLENPKDYKERVSKYLGKRQYLSIIVQPFLKLQEFIEYLGKKLGVKAKEYEELKRAIKDYTLYLSYKRFALDVVSKHIPEALPSLVTLIGNLEEWNKYRSFSNIDKKALKEYADKYYVMAHFLSSIPEWWLSKWEHTPEEIKEFTKGLETLAKGGTKIIEGLYGHYKEVYKSSLEKISKGNQTIPPYKLEEARASAAGRIEYLLVNYFRNHKEYEDQLMKYVEMKP